MRSPRKKDPPKPGVAEAHSVVFRKKEMLLKSETWGCFYCCKIYPKPEKVRWVYPFAWRRSEPEETTALCPHCGIDSCLGDAAGFSLTTEFLKDMEAYWFGY